MENPLTERDLKDIEKQIEKANPSELQSIVRLLLVEIRRFHHLVSHPDTWRLKGTIRRGETVLIRDVAGSFTTTEDGGWTGFLLPPKPLPLGECVITLADGTRKNIKLIENYETTEPGFTVSFTGMGTPPPPMPDK